MGNYLKTAIAGALMLVSAAASSAPLLSQADQEQLADWLGEGQLSLTSIYSKASGDTAANFHQAVDGKGRTFSVMQATNSAGQTWLIGGYNPQSWSTSGSFNVTDQQADRKAFLFNLTMGQMHKQTPADYVLPSAGSFQTYNDVHFGPTFGIGHDLYVPDDLTHGGYSALYSYINTNGYDFKTSLLDGSVYVAPDVTFGAIEVYTIAAVPEPGSALMLMGGLGLLALAHRRRRR